MPINGIILRGRGGLCRLLVEAHSVNTAAGAVLFPLDQALAAAQQGRSDAATGTTGSTLGQLASASPRTYAFGQYRGNTIFYNAQAFAINGLGSGYAMLTLFHETLRLAGFSDEQLRRAFGISQQVFNSHGSTSITDALIGRCGQ